MKSLAEISLSELRARRPDLVESIEMKARKARLRKKVGQQEVDEAFQRHADRGLARITPVTSEDEAEEADGRPARGEAKRIELVEGYRDMGLTNKEAGLAADLELAFERFLPEKRQRPAKPRQSGSNSGSAQQKMEEAFARVLRGQIPHDDGTTF